jgi:hypothetical protein
MFASQHTEILANIAALAMTCSTHMQHGSSSDPVAVKLKCSEEQRLMVFENRVLSEIFGPKKLHNEELHDLYQLPNIIWVIKLGQGIDWRIILKWILNKLVWIMWTSLI